MEMLLAHRGRGDTVAETAQKEAAAAAAAAAASLGSPGSNPEPVTPAQHMFPSGDEELARAKIAGKWRDGAPLGRGFAQPYLNV